MHLNKGKEHITLLDLKQHSIWKCNEIADLMYPVTNIADLPEDHFDLSIRTVLEEHGMMRRNSNGY